MYRSCKAMLNCRKNETWMSCTKQFQNEMEI